MNATASPEPIDAAAGRRAARRRAFSIIGLVVLVVGGAATAWYLLWGRWSVETDNAYVGGDLVQVTAQSAGTVIAVGARDTDGVKAGQVLVRLDPADAQLALDRAEAALAAAVRSVRGQVSTASGSGSLVAARQADVARARTELGRLVAERDRRAALRDRQLVSAEVLAEADAAVKSARAQLEAAEGSLAAARAQWAGARSAIDGTTLADNPAVLTAAANVREAFIARARADIAAPVGGQVARRNVEVGMRVQPGAVLMTVVPVDHLWVDANFKEDQLANVRIGQPVTLTSDFYGDDVTFKGTVVGLGAGTGSAFALLPAQNASGNWIKVVQRVPVRIALEPEALRAHPLRVGLSMRVEIDVRNTDGAQLSTGVHLADVDRTAVYEGVAERAKARVDAIIAANAG